MFFGCCCACDREEGDGVCESLDYLIEVKRSVSWSLLQNWVCCHEFAVNDGGLTLGAGEMG